MDGETWPSLDVMAESAAPASGSPVVAPVARRVRLHRLEPDGFASHDPIDYGRPARRYDRRAWTSEPVELGFDATSVIASWQATTPGDTWIEVAVRGGRIAPEGRWIVLGHWAETSGAITRTTLPGQDSSHYAVAADEISILAGHEWRYAQARVLLCRPAEAESAWPTVSALALLTSDELANVRAAESPASGIAHAIDVPAHAQYAYRDQLPELDGGGQSWCSPASVAMVLERWGVRLPEPVLPYVARHTYDQAYGGTGNWAFSTAFAARFGLSAYVTRLRTLAEAELFTRAGLPLVLGLTFTADQLDGAGYDTRGHLLVLTGFDRDGNPVVNDPAAHGGSDDAAVRTTYRRDQFLAAWQHRGSGIAYVIHPLGHPLPPQRDEANW